MLNSIYCSDILPVTKWRFYAISVNLHKKNILPKTRELFPSYLTTGTLKIENGSHYLKKKTTSYYYKTVINELYEYYGCCNHLLFSYFTEKCQKMQQQNYTISFQFPVSYPGLVADDVVLAKS